MAADTTIRVSFETRKSLKQLKVHPNQSYDELLRVLIKRIQWLGKDDC